MTLNGLRSRMLTWADDDAWRAARTEGHRIGGSDVANIMGIAPASWGGGWSLWESRQGLTPASTTVADEQRYARMDAGNHWETRVLEDYQRMLGGPALMRPGKVSIIHETEKWAVGTPDDFASLDPAQEPLVDYLEPITAAMDVGVEAKTSIMFNIWGEPGDIRCWSAEAAVRVPVYYAQQAFWYLEITGLPAWDLVVMLPSFRDFFEVKVYRIWRDDRIQKALLRRCKAWREKHLVNGAPPPLDGSDVADRHLRRTHGTPANKTRRQGTNEEYEIAHQYAELGHEIKTLKGAREVVGARLRDAIGADYGLYFGDGKKASWYGKKNSKDNAPARALRVDGFTFGDDQ